MQDLLWQLKNTDSFVIYTTLAFVAAVGWFLREIAGSTGLAVFSLPLLMIGGIAGPAFLTQQTIVLSYDKNVNVATAAGLGVLIALLVILLSKWLLTVLNEHRVSRAKIVAVPSRPPRLRR
ncbi:hypothetical protein [Hyphomicrobium sp.]|uniref:hypothetical protein n=1 Tax=Hyphomicrobium sp. TaxID=82 RepID=UPI002D7666C3|nr:hypothetical protein [Hyphomicrobium sp.]HET6388288.1 hypothetical protein [Hyphomicrobium sp.]